MIKKILSILISFSLMAVMIPLMSVTTFAGETSNALGSAATLGASNSSYVCEIDGKGYDSITDALDAWHFGESKTNPTVITLLANVTEKVVIDKGRYITIDLDGNVLASDGTSCVILNRGTLTVLDSNSGGKIHRFSPNSDGLWVLDEDSGPESVSGGCITGGIGAKVTGLYRYGGGIYTATGATLNLNGVNVIGNGGASSCFGGGILGNVSSTINITGGSIRGNVGMYGGGVDAFSSLSITGCVISENVATKSGGGVYFGSSSGSFFATADLTIGAGTVICGNTSKAVSGSSGSTSSASSDDGALAADNLHLEKDSDGNQALITLSGERTGINIGVNTAAGTGQFTNSATSEDMKYFSSDNESYGVAYNAGSGEGYLEIVSIPTAVKSATYHASLTLTKDIDAKFSMRNLGTDGAGAGFDRSLLSLVVDGAGIDEGKISYDESTNIISCIVKEVKPKDIGTDIHIDIYYDGVLVETVDYAVTDYCNAVFKAYESSGEKYAKINTLCEALVNYGAWAENYDSELNAIAATSTSIDSSSEISSSNESSSSSETSSSLAKSTLNVGHEIDFSNYEVTCGNASAVYEGYADGADAMLSLGSTICLQYSIDNCTVGLENDNEETQNFYILNDAGQQIIPERVSVTQMKNTNDSDDVNNGNDGSIDGSGGTTTLISIDLYANQLSTSYTMKLKGVSTDAFHITYSVYNYCSAVQNVVTSDYPAFSTTLKTLCKAIHNYGQAVQNYIK